jgi:hypothetical protein
MRIGQILGNEIDLARVVGRNREANVFVDSRRQHETVVVIDVLANDVNASRREENVLGLRIENLGEMRGRALYEFFLFHFL